MKDILMNKLTLTLTILLFTAAAFGAGLGRKHMTVSQKAAEEDNEYVSAVLITKQPGFGWTEETDAAPYGTHTSIIQARINRSGQAEDFVIEKSAGYGLDEMCIQSLKRSTWKPATLRGIPTNAPLSQTCTYTFSP